MSGQSGRIVGTIAGAALAYFTGGASYVALGATLGDAVGSLLDPKAKTEGPRLDDLKVQVSTYGVGIPILYGTERLGGNVIWSTDKLELPFVTSSGKGGGTENTSYRYFVHMSLLLCETPRDGSTVAIRKIWKDGKLVYDISSGISIGSALATADSPYTSLVLWQGGAAQLPDSIEESFEGGPGSCSAYRGVVRVRLFAVECPSGRVPQFSFELMVNPTSGNESVTGTSSVISGNASTTIQPRSFIPTNGDPIPVYVKQTVGSDQSTGAYALGLDYVSKVATSPLLGIWNAYSHLRGRSDIPLAAIRGVGPGGSPDSGNLNFYDGNGKLTKALPVDTLAITSTGRYCKFGNYVAISSDTGSLQMTTRLHRWDSGVFIGAATGGDPFDILITTNFAWLVYKNATTFRYTVELRSLVDFSVITSGTLPLDFGASLNSTSLCVGAAADTIDAVTVYNSSPPLAKLWKVDASLVATQIGTSAVAYPLGLLIDDARIAVNGTDVYGVSEATTAGPTWTLTPFMYRFSVQMPNAVKPKDIIVDQCQRAGQLRYDVSALPDADTLTGYKIAGPASARANIEPLLSAFGYFVVDEDNAVKFKRYADVVSVTSVTFDELGQAEDGSEPADAMPLTRTQEADLPRSMTVSYIEPASDYQTASEKEIRQVTGATQDSTLDLPMAINSNQAKAAAQRMLYEAWSAQNTRSLTVSRKFAFVSPGDGVTIEYPRGTLRLWLVMSVNDTGAACEWSVRPGDASVYTQTAIGATGYSAQSVAPLAAPLRAQILDIPALRDADNNAGPYVALDSYAAVPADGQLYVGDDDNSLLTRGTVSASAPIGFAETAGASWTPLTVDEASLFTVNLGDDVFASVTRDVLLAGGGEYWAYGAAGRWEIGASAVGSSLGGGRYILSRHLRGQFGTERFIGTQQIGDTFVLLRIAGMLRPDTGVGGIGQTKSYRAVTKGRTKDSATSQAYANTGEGLTPLSPINLRRTDTNDYAVDRRSRMAMNNATGALPLGEATEHYLWEFYSSGSFSTLVGTVVTNTPIVTAAQQTLIGITPSAVSFIKVRQVSDSIGQGHELQATL